MPRRTLQASGVSIHFFGTKIFGGPMILNEKFQMLSLLFRRLLLSLSIDPSLPSLVLLLYCSVPLLLLLLMMLMLLLLLLLLLMMDALCVTWYSGDQLRRLAEASAVPA